MLAGGSQRATQRRGYSLLLNRCRVLLVCKGVLTGGEASGRCAHQRFNFHSPSFPHIPSTVVGLHTFVGCYSAGEHLHIILSVTITPSGVGRIRDLPNSVGSLGSRNGTGPPAGRVAGLQPCASMCDGSEATTRSYEVRPSLDPTGIIKRQLAFRNKEQS